jgi:fatty acid desaturase
MQRNSNLRSLSISTFTKRNDLKAFFAIFGDWLIIVLLIYFSEYMDSNTITAFCLIAIGYFQFALGEAIVHDASHRNLFLAASRNDHFDFLYALPFAMTVRQYRKEHRSHHQNFGSPRDHIVADYAAFGLTSTAKPNLYWILFGRPLIGFCALGRILWLVRTTTIEDRRRICLFWLTVATASVTCNFSRHLAFYWLIPLLFIFPVFLYWSEIGDHYRAPSGTRSRVGLCYNFFWHNNGYHSLHHRYPLIPFHQLAYAHRALEIDDPDAVSGWFGIWLAVSRPLDDPPHGRSGFWPATKEII